MCRLLGRILSLNCTIQLITIRSGAALLRWRGGNLVRPAAGAGCSRAHRLTPGYGRKCTTEDDWGDLREFSEAWAEITASRLCCRLRIRLLLFRTIRDLIGHRSMPDSLRQDVAKRQITHQCEYSTNTIHLKKNRHVPAPNRFSRATRPYPI